MSPKKKVKLNESPEMNLIWTDGDAQLLLESVRNFKTQNVGVRATLFDPTTCFFFLNVFLFFFVKCKIISLLQRNNLWQIIIAKISICNCTAENENQKNCHRKIINILNTIYYYVFRCCIIRVCRFSCITKFI